MKISEQLEFIVTDVNGLYNLRKILDDEIEFAILSNLCNKYARSLHGSLSYSQEYDYMMKHFNKRRLTKPYELIHIKNALKNSIDKSYKYLLEIS